MSVKKVVLVDDDADDRCLFIEFYVHRTDIILMNSLKSGQELIAYLSGITQTEDFPDLILIDQNMPKMNGRQTLSVLKANEIYCRIPVAIYSTYPDSDLIIECKQMGVIMVASKPIDYDGYQKMMDDLLQALE